jgi:hypothetical protein
VIWQQAFSVPITVTGMARVQGEFTATSRRCGSSMMVWYRGQVEFEAGMPEGNVVVLDGTGGDAGYRASGTIEDSVVGLATLQRADLGLCYGCCGSAGAIITAVTWPRSRCQARGQDGGVASPTGCLSGPLFPP